MYDYGDGKPEQVRISGAPGSGLLLDGLEVAGGALAIDDAGSARSGERFTVTLRHCTLVPGWDAGGAAPWRGRASIVARARRLALRLEHSIAGALHAVRGDALLALQVSDSIIDAGHAAGLAIGDDGYGCAHARVSVLRSTVIGLAQVEELSVAESSVFLGPLLVVRRSTGRLSACHVAQGSRTPPRLAPAEAPLRYLGLQYSAPGYCEVTVEREEDQEMQPCMGVGWKSAAWASPIMHAST
jgi:hypothetical protein